MNLLTNTSFPTKRFNGKLTKIAFWVVMFGITGRIKILWNSVIGQLLELIRNSLIPKYVVDVI
jgi:hypothetical protein